MSGLSRRTKLIHVSMWGTSLRAFPHFHLKRKSKLWLSLKWPLEEPGKECAGVEGEAAVDYVTAECGHLPLKAPQHSVSALTSV